MDQEVKEGVVDLLKRQKKQMKLVEQFEEKTAIDFYELPPHKKTKSMIDIIIKLIGVNNEEKYHYLIGQFLTGEFDITAANLVDSLLEERKIKVNDVIENSENGYHGKVIEIRKNYFLVNRGYKENELWHKSNCIFVKKGK